MGTKPFTANSAVWVGLGLALLAGATVSVAGEPFERPTLTAPSPAPDGGEVLPCLLALGNDPGGVLGADLSASETVALDTGPAQVAAGGEIGSGQDPMKLAGPPTTLLLMLQGLVCVGLIRGRRKWAVALLAVVAVGRAGLGALPQLIGLPKTKAVSAPPPADTGIGLAPCHSLPAASPALSYAGLLRRLDGDAASASARTLLDPKNLEPAAKVTASGLAAGFHVLAALPTPEPGLPAPADIAFLPSEVRPTLPVQPLAFALFARPPPRHRNQLLWCSGSDSSC